MSEGIGGGFRVWGSFAAGLKLKGCRDFGFCPETWSVGVWGLGGFGKV